MRNSKYFIISFIFASFVIGNGTLISQIAKVVLFVGFLYGFVNKTFLVKSKIFFLWNIIFALYCFLSIRWSIDQEESSAMSMTVLYSCICNIALYGLFCDRRFTFENIIKTIFICSILAYIYYILQNGLSVIGEEGRLSSQIGINLNSLGLSSAYGMICGILLFLKSNNKYHLLGSISLLVFILLTGSRTSLIFPILSCAIWYIMYSKNILIKIIPAFLISALVIFLVLNVESLYNLIGYRVEGLINGLLDNGQGDVDDSAKTRLMFIERGMEIFQENKWLGYGLASFGSVTGFNVYAHNNYVETLVGLGIIGTVIYYFIYLLILIKFYRLSRTHLKGIHALFLGVIISILVTHYGNVAYFCLADNAMLTFLAVCAFERNDDLICYLKNNDV